MSTRNPYARAANALLMVGALAAALWALVGVPALAAGRGGRIGHGRGGRAHSSPGVKVLDEDLDPPAPSADLGDLTRGLDDAYDRYLAGKTRLDRAHRPAIFDAGFEFRAMGLALRHAGSVDYRLTRRR